MRGPAERIEDIRVAWERDLEAEIDSAPRMPRPARHDLELTASRVPLGRAMAERVHRVAKDAAGRLRCRDAFALYQTPRHDLHLNAQALMSETPFGIRLIGPVARALDDGALAALIGHELGHWLALGPRASPPSLVLRAWERGADRELVRFSVLAAELTADRFGLLACGGELEAAVRLEVANQTLDSPTAMGLCEFEHLDDECRKVESKSDPLVREEGYPTPAFRLYATHLFWRSDLHKTLTGVGPGDLALRDVDAQLHALCAPARSREPSQARSRARSPRTGHEVRWAPPSLERPARLAWTSVQKGARDVASSTASAVGRLMGDRAGRPESDRQDLEEAFTAAVAELEDADSLEARFRELEKRERGK